MRSLQERSDLKLEEDVYVARARPGHPHLLINQGYRRVAIVDCVSASVVRSIALPAEVEDFPVASWVVSPDGGHSVLFGRENTEVALRVDHETGAVETVALPTGFFAPVGLAWFAPELRLVDGKGRSFRLEGGALVSLGAAEVKAATKELRKRVENLDELTVLRSADAGEALYLFGPDKLGLATFDGKTALFAPHDGSAVDVARIGESLFVCFERRVEQHEGREHAQLLEARRGEYFVAIEAVTHGGAAHLVLVAGSDASAASRLRFFG